MLIQRHTRLLPLQGDTMNVSNVFGRQAIGVLVLSWFASGAVAEQSRNPTNAECAHYHQLCDPGGRAPNDPVCSDERLRKGCESSHHPHAHPPEDGESPEEDDMKCPEGQTLVTIITCKCQKFVKPISKDSCAPCTEIGRRNDCQ
jgi:hypothetical protein